MVIILTIYFSIINTYLNDQLNSEKKNESNVAMVDYQNILHLHSVLSKILINFVNDIFVLCYKHKKNFKFYIILFPFPMFFSGST